MTLDPPIIMTASCWASSIKHPPFPHCNDEQTCINRKYANFSYVFISQITAKDVVIVARVADELALEEGDVDDGGVEVDELEDEHFERQVVVEVRLGAMHL